MRASICQCLFRLLACLAIYFSLMWHHQLSSPQAQPPLLGITAPNLECQHAWLQQLAKTSKPSLALNSDEGKLIVDLADSAARMGLHITFELIGVEGNEHQLLQCFSAMQTSTLASLLSGNITIRVASLSDIEPGQYLLWGQKEIPLQLTHASILIAGQGGLCPAYAIPPESANSQQARPRPYNFLTSLGTCSEQCLETFHAFVGGFSPLLKQAAAIPPVVKHYVWSHSIGTVFEIPITDAAASLAKAVLWHLPLPSPSIQINWLINLAITPRFIQLLPWLESMGVEVQQRVFTDSQALRRVMGRSKVLNDAKYEVSPIEQNAILADSAAPQAWLLSLEMLKTHRRLVKDILLMGVAESGLSQQAHREVLLFSDTMDAVVGGSESAKINVIFEEEEIKFVMERAVEWAQFMRVRLPAEEEILSAGNLYKREQDLQQLMHDQQLLQYQQHNRHAKGLDDHMQQLSQLVLTHPISPLHLAPTKTEDLIHKPRPSFKNELMDRILQFHIDASGQWVLADLARTQKQMVAFSPTECTPSASAHEPLVQYLRQKGETAQWPFSISFCLGDPYLLVSLAEVAVSLQRENTFPTIFLCHPRPEVIATLIKTAVLNDFSQIVKASSPDRPASSNIALLEKVDQAGTIEGADTIVVPLSSQQECPHALPPYCILR